MELKNKQEEKGGCGAMGLVWGTAVHGGVPGEGSGAGRAPARQTHGPKPAHSAVTVTSWGCGGGIWGCDDTVLPHSSFPSSSSSSSAA